jgi:hypothetical protein
MIVGVIIAVAVVVAAVLGTAVSAIKIVREYQRVVLFRLGRAVGARGPGFTVINPVIDRVSWVDLRERYLEIPHQTAITRDNAPIVIDFIIFYKVLDPVASVLAVQDFKGAALNIASTTLRSVVGDMSLDDVLSKREDMNRVLRVKLGLGLPVLNQVKLHQEQGRSLRNGRGDDRAAAHPRVNTGCVQTSRPTTGRAEPPPDDPLIAGRIRGVAGSWAPRLPSARLVSKSSAPPGVHARRRHERGNESLVQLYETHQVE